MSSNKHSKKLHQSQVFLSGEPFTLNAVMNIVRCSRERARQVVWDMTRNGEVIKINDDCYRKRGMSDNWLRKSWRKDDSVYRMIEAQCE